MISPSPRHRPGQLNALACFLLLSGVVAAVSGFVTVRSVNTWYVTLAKPPFNPPNWVFGPAWTLLYILMAVAAWRIWRLRLREQAGAALRLYGAQLLLNFLWSLIFFGSHQIGLALIDIIGLLILLTATVVSFARRDVVAGILMTPYLGWVAFATVLNWSIWQLN